MVQNRDMTSALGSSGSTTAWRRLRAQVLAEEPVCPCGQPATEADHIIERVNGGDDRRENLQGLCHACHAAKTARTHPRGDLAGGVPPPTRDW